MADEAVEDFRSSLTDLTFNSKPLINMLTMLAEENVQYAEQIVKVIEEHIQKAASTHKLPALYLIDSIIKNVSNSNYLQLFKRNIVTTFVFVFDKVDEKTRQSMFKLRQTWNDLFPPEKLFTLDVQVNHIDPAWPITAQPRASTSIHVNPKFLMKAPQEVDSSSPADVQPKAKSAPAPVSSKKSKVKEKESTVPEIDDREDIIRDMMAKKQELLRLEQKKLELQLAEARASLEQQAKKLAAHQAAQVDSVSVVQQPARTSVRSNPAPNMRDPRVRTDAAVSSAANTSLTIAGNQQPAPVILREVQPFGSVNMSEAVNSNVAESAVLLKTAFVSAANTSLPAANSISLSSATQQAPSTASGSSVSAPGNIFDRILDLVPGTTAAPRSETSSQLAVTASGTIPVSVQQPVVKGEIASCDETVVDVKKLPTPPPEETKTAAAPVPTTAAIAGEAQKVEKSSGAKNVGKKSVEGSSTSRPLMAGRRRTSSRDKRGSGASSSKKEKEKESGPAAKKVKPSKDKEPIKTTKDLKPTGLSSDLEELFGKEDKDYRRLPTIPKLDPAASQRQPLLGTAPAQELISPQSKAWANFKADHPEAFPFRQSQARRLSATDLTARRKHPGSSSKQALLPTPALGAVEKAEASPSKKQLVSGDKTATDKWSQKEEGQMYNPCTMHPAVRRPLAMDSNSRSPQRHERIQEHSPRYDDHAVPLPVKGSLLGDKPMSGRSGAAGVSAYNGPDEPAKSLLPAPGVHMMRLEWQSGSKRPDDIPLWDAPVKSVVYDEDRFYVPEFDVRWCVRAQVGDRSSNMYTVIINDRQFEMAVNSKRRIQCNNSVIEVVLDSKTRQLKIDDIGCYRFGSPPKNVTLKGNTYRIFVRGPEKKLWIDDRLFEINVDSPPERIIIGEKEHKIAIDGAAGRIFVDSYDICPFGTEEEQVVQLAYVMHTITFKPPQKQILIDGNLCTVDLSGKFPVIWIDNRPRGIRFDGEPREIFIDDTPWTVPMNAARKCRIDGPKPRLLAFGGPGHEVIIDDQWFEVKFGGEAKIVKFGGGTHKIQLRGNPPEVKILPEVIPAHELLELMSRRGYGERGPVNRLDPRSDRGGRSLPPPPVPVPSLLG